MFTVPVLGHLPGVGFGFGVVEVEVEVGCVGDDGDDALSQFFASGTFHGQSQVCVSGL